MDNFEDRIENYYKKIDKKAFEALINVIDNFKRKDFYEPHSEIKNRFFEGIEKIQFSPNINFKCKADSQNTSYDSIDYISKYRKEIVEELKKIKENYLLGFKDSTPFGVIIDYNNNIKQIDFEKTFFNNNTFNRNLASIYNKLGIDITTGTFIDKLDIQLFDNNRTSLKKAFSYTFYKEDQSTVTIEQFVNNQQTKMDRLFSVENEKYHFSLQKENFDSFCFNFNNRGSGMTSVVTLIFDDILFEYSYHEVYKEFLKSNFNDNFCNIHAIFKNRQDLEYIVDTGINGCSYDKLLDFLDPTNDFYNIRYEIDDNKKSVAFAKCYDNDFDMSKMIPKDILDILPLYDINIKYSNKYDKTEPEILDIIKKFEYFRDNSFYKKNSISQNKKLKKQK